MRKIRSIATQSPAIAISILALVFSLGTGAGYAATHDTTKTTTHVTWHNLGTTNGWHSGAHAADIPETDNPGYTIINDVVYLTGSVVTANSTNPELLPFAALPKGYRPTHALAFAAGGPYDALLGDTFLCEVFIESNGAMYSHCPQDIWGGAAGSYTSLNGLSFPLGS
jgi:hypothetical protein